MLIFSPRETTWRSQSSTSRGLRKTRRMIRILHVPARLMERRCRKTLETKLENMGGLKYVKQANQIRRDMWDARKGVYCYNVRGIWGDEKKQRKRREEKKRHTQSLKRLMEKEREWERGRRHTTVCERERERGRESTMRVEVLRK